MPNPDEDLAHALRENELLAAENERLLRELREASEKYAEIRSSLSWKLMAPLRAAADLGIAARRIVTRNGAAPHGPLPLNNENYRRWIALYDKLTDTDRRAIRQSTSQLKNKPPFSLIVIVHNPAAELLHRTIQSIRRQIYREWEICLVDDVSSAPHVARALSACGDDPRVRILRRSSREGSAKDEAIAMARGQFVAILDAGDVLAESALFEMAAELDSHPETELIYSDEDELDSRGERCNPKFKTGWNPDLFRVQNYLGSLAVYRRDLAFQSAVTHVRHVPAVLCHRSPAPTDSVVDKPKSSLEQPKVSIIIPTRDRAELLRQCMEGLLHRTNYPSLEIIVVDNGSREESTLRLLETYRSARNISVLPFAGDFNWAAMNNRAAAIATGEVLLFLNNDTDVWAAGWLSEMVSHTVRSEIGAVGAKLLFADGTVQHAGIWLGPNAHVRHGLRLSKRDDPGYLGQLSLTRNLSSVTGACMSIRRAVFLEIGCFDESFPVGYNDIDLCLRLIQRGYRVVWTPYAELLHLESASRGSGEWRWRKEEADFLRFRSRWEQQLEHDPFFNPNLDLIGEETLGLAFPPRVTKPWRR